MSSPSIQYPLSKYTKYEYFRAYCMAIEPDDYGWRPIPHYDADAVKLLAENWSYRYQVSNVSGDEQYPIVIRIWQRNPENGNFRVVHTVEEIPDPKEPGYEMLEQALF